MSSYARVSDVTIPDDSPEAKCRAQAWQLIEGLSSMYPFFEHYDILASEMPLENAMNPRHRNELTTGFQESWASMTQQDRMALINVVDETVFREMGIILNPNERRQAKKVSRMSRPQLNTVHCLALLDYTSSYSGSFNAVNSSARLWHYYGIAMLSKITAPLAIPFSEAIKILETHADFRHEGPAYKGILIANPAGNFRMSCMQAGMTLQCAHGLSATSEWKKNYASHSHTWPTRDMQITFVQARGVKVHLFNNVTSRDEMEIIIPEGRQLEFLSPAEIDRERFKDNGGPWSTYYCRELPPPASVKIKDGYLRC